MIRERVRQELDLLRASVPGEGRLMAVDLNVHVEDGPVLGAVDKRGNLHLLVAIDDASGLRTDRRSQGLTIEPREYSDREVVPSGLVLDIKCGSPTQNDVFVSFAEELCSALAAQPVSGKSLPYKTLERWRRIFEGEKPAGLPRTSIIGVYGELVFLELLAEIDAGSALGFWTGPRSHRHDFTGHANAVEVKTSEISQAREIEVHGLEQLEATPETELFLAYFRIESNPSGVSPADLIESCHAHGVNPDELATLLDSAGLGGLQSANEKFRISESVIYPVDDHFPRLVISDLKSGTHPEGVTRITYRVDLSAATAPSSALNVRALAKAVSGA